MPLTLRALPLALALLCAPPAAAQSLLKPTPLPFNTADHEDEPHLAPDGLVLYYTRNAGKKDDIYVATRKKGQRTWPTKGTRIDEWVPTPVDDRSAFITGPGFPRTFFYATRKNEKGTNFDLYGSILDDAGRAYTPPRPVPVVNTRDDEMHPWLADKGKSLYFSRKTREGWQVFVATRKDATGPGNWLKVTPAGIPAGYHHATLTPNGQVMYLQGPLGKGRTGLFVSTRSAKGWSPPAEIAGINHPDGKTGDRSPNLSRDGQTLYFASDRPNGQGGLDLYWVPTYLLKKK